ncbi:MAG: DUF4445 domain-containing protein [Eubacteriaceae bacterium]|nr:DUF4445 domain-containing protein [Eubacteriaceae bacterium]
MTTQYIKKHFNLIPPTEDDARSDRTRIADELYDEFGNVEFSYDAVRMLYPLCREAEWDITVTLVKKNGFYEVILVESGDTSAHCYAVAVDYGSTTVKSKLMDLATGQEVASASCPNPQIEYGDEILSRIFYTKDNYEHLQEIHSKTVNALNTIMDLLEEKSGVSKKEYLGIAIGANTTMCHFIAGLFPWGIFETPYAPVSTEFDLIKAKDMGLDIPGYVYIAPSSANYLGGDIIGGLLTTDIEKEEGYSVFLDIGTNGELVIGNSHFLVAGAGAAGPAFEVGVSKFGMKAEDGAVNHVKIEDGKINVEIIGGVPAKGICGTGIVELLSELFLNRFIDGTGTLHPEMSEDIITIQNPDSGEDELAVIYAYEEDGDPIFFSQTDIENFIQTKAAAHTMVASLLEYMHLTLNDIHKFYLAGAFGTYVDLESAITIGLYPDIPRDRYVALGNSSLEGAKRVLLDTESTVRMKYFTDNMTYVQFGEVAMFVQNMMAAQFLPHTDTNLYPTVMERYNKMNK